MIGDTLGPSARAVSTLRMNRMVEYNSQLFREGQAFGVVRPFDLEGLRLINMTGGGGLAKAPNGDPAALAAIAAEMVETLRLGLAPL